jgi:hypothetical protein
MKIPPVFSSFMLVALKGIMLFLMKVPPVRSVFMRGSEGNSGDFFGGQDTHAVVHGKWDHSRIPIHPSGKRAEEWSQ